MARKKQSERGQPQVTPAQGRGLLNSQIEKGRELLGSGSVDKDAYGSWELVTRNLLSKVFGENSPNVSSISSVGKYGSFPMGAAPEWRAEHRRKSLQTQLTKLEGLVELLETECDLENDS